jgi:methyl-accepting chemotaxis protein
MKVFDTSVNFLGTFTRKFKIGTRLLGAFIVVAVIAALVGFIGSANLKKISTNDTWMYEKTTIPLGQLALVERDFQNVRIATYRGLMQPDISKARDEFNKIADYKTYIAVQLDGYTKTFIDANDEANYTKLRALMDTYFKQIQEVQDARLAGRNFTLEELAHTAGAAADVTNSLNNMITSIIAAAKITSERNAADASSAIMFMAISVGVAFTLSIILGIFVTKASQRRYKDS